jgi:lipopolysaccharide biosynthesis regulator YciM
MLNAAVLASNGEYDKAYDAYNEVMFWNRDVLPNSRLTLDRAYQVDLVELMKGVEKPSVRMQAIMKVEAELLAKYGSQEEINKVSPAQ